MRNKRAKLAFWASYALLWAMVLGGPDSGGPTAASRARAAYGLSQPSNVTMLQPAVAPTLASSGLTGASAIMVWGTDSVGQIVLNGGAVNLSGVNGTLTVTFAYPQAFSGGTPIALVVGGLYANGASVASTTLPCFATCTGTTLTIPITNLSIGLGATYKFNYYVFSAAAQ